VKGVSYVRIQSFIEVERMFHEMMTDAELPAVAEERGKPVCEQINKKLASEN
jgi:hypothetical protein